MKGTILALLRQSGRFSRRHVAIPAKENIMQAANGGEAAARALMELGVEFVFTLTGGHLNHIHQILEKSPVRLVDTRHEQAATFMADAYARMTGKPGVAMLTAGPGFTNCISPLQ